MSLKQDLKNLKKQKRQELYNLHHTYLRTKRDVKRAASPDRFVRKHLGATIGAAAVAGLLLAPRPAARATQKEIEKAARKIAREQHTGPSLAGRVTQLVKNALGQLEHAIPAPKDASHNGHNGKSKPPKMTGLLGSLLGVLISKVDLPKLASELSKQIMGRMKGGAPKADGGEPNVSVADVGTVRPDQLEDFE
jgi:hypothetical protein